MNDFRETAAAPDASHDGGRTMQADPRYSRQILFTPIGAEGQVRLQNARVAIVGMGALGSVLANHMARAGVGHIRVIDRDFVEESNLQRQMLYDEEDARLSTPKAEAASRRLREINSLITVEPVVIDLNPTNAEELLTDVDLILDGTDNFAVRFLINDVSVKHGIPWIYGGAVSSRGVCHTVLPGQTPCLRCLFGQPPEQGTVETCDTAGVIGPIIHITASFQAVEAMKYLAGKHDALNRKMIHVEIWHNRHAAVDVSNARKPDCPCCAGRSFDYLEFGSGDDTIQSLCGRNSVQIMPVVPRRMDLEAWADKWQKIGNVERNPYLLKFRPGAGTVLVLFPDGRVIVQGTDDITAAKSLYTRYIGM